MITKRKRKKWGKHHPTSPPSQETTKCRLKNKKKKGTLHHPDQPKPTRQVPGDSWEWPEYHSY